MAKLEIKTYPDDVLSRKAQPVDNITDAEKALAADMIETMIDGDGVGLAANQVDVLKRIFVAAPEGKKGEKYVFVNPVILAAEGEIVNEEGCLSVPGVTGDVMRAKRIEIEAQGLDGAVFKTRLEGLMAIIFQHELDHLDGKLFIERIGFAERQRIAPGLKALEESKS